MVESLELTGMDYLWKVLCVIVIVRESAEYKVDFKQSPVCVYVCK